MRAEPKRRILVTALAALLASATASHAVGAPQDGEESGEQASEGEGDEAGEDAKDADTKWFAVTGDIHTGTGAVLRETTLVAKNGVIQEIGLDVYVPDDAKVLDARGMQIYPGLVAIQSSRLFGGQSDLENTFDPYEPALVLALSGGITTAVQGNEAAKLKRSSIEDIVVQSKCFETFSFGVNSPKGKRTLRERLEEAADYVRAYRHWEDAVKRDKSLKEPKAPKDRSLVSVLRGEIRAKFSADERTDLLEIARLAQRYGFRPVIEGCREGWTVADELGRAGASAIITPRDRRARDERLVRPGGSSIENAALLHAAGVPVAIIPSNTGISLSGIVGRDLMHLTIEAGFAIRGGLSESAALEAITIVPARMIGIDHRVGTLEAGKDCDLIVTDGELLHYQTFVQWTVVQGEIAYDKQDELYFAHIRPRPESALAPEEKVDRGESPPPTEPSAPPEEGD